jgi:hypothetical protein
MNAPDSAKTYAALYLAGLFAEAAFRSEATAAWWGFGNGWINYFKVSNSFPDDLLLPEWGGGYSIDEEFARRIPCFSPKGIRVCVSDFLWETPPEIPLRKMAEGASELIIASVLSESELDPPLYGASTLADSETGEKLDLMVGPSEKAAYLKRLDSHIQMWKDCASSMGAKYCLVKAVENAPPDISPLIEAGALEWV